MILLMKKWFFKLEIDNDGIHTNEYLYRNRGFSCNTPASIISAFYKAQINMVNTYKEKEHMWILSQIASTRQLRVYTDFNEQIHKDKDETVHIDFMDRIYKTSYSIGTFQIRGIDMHHFCNHYYTNYVKVSDPDLFVMSMNQTNVLIKKLFSDSENLTNLTSLGVYKIFQRYYNNELQVIFQKCYSMISS